jgi:hypothetical protein
MLADVFVGVHAGAASLFTDRVFSEGFESMGHKVTPSHTRKFRGTHGGGNCNCGVEGESG